MSPVRFIASIVSNEKIVYQVYRTLIFSISFDLISDQLHSRWRCYERSEDPGDLEKEWLKIRILIDRIVQKIVTSLILINDGFL